MPRMYCSRHNKYMSKHEFLLLFVCLFVLLGTPDQPVHPCSFLATRTSLGFVSLSLRREGVTFGTNLYESITGVGKRHPCSLV